MKNILPKFSLLSEGILMLGGILTGCSAEAPFESEAVGTLRLHTTLSHTTTRTLTEDENSELGRSCVVYVSNLGREAGKSLVFKAQGLPNVPESIKLPVGNYAAEAWAGDSLAANKEGKRFFRGYQEFELSGSSDKSVSLPCRMLNTVVSFQLDGIDASVMRDDYTITVAYGMTALEFTHEDVETNTKGYFMLDQDNVKELKGILAQLDADASNSAAIPTGQQLQFKISGTRADGQPIEVKQTLGNVKPAFHYIVKMKYSGHSSSGETGGAILSVETEDAPVTDDTTVPVSGPTITGNDFNIDSPLPYSTMPQEIAVQVCANGGIQSITVASTTLSLPATELLDAGSEHNGITITEVNTNEKGVASCHLLFDKALFDVAAPGTHTITIKATDTAGLTIEKSVTVSK